MGPVRHSRQFASPESGKDERARDSFQFQFPLVVAGDWATAGQKR